jgi:hypothetical protein
VADIPKEAIVAAANASSAHFVNCDYGNTWEDCPTCRRVAEHAKCILEGAAPVLREAIRDDLLRERGMHPDQIAARKAASEQRDDRDEVAVRIEASVLREAADRAEYESRRRPVLTLVAGWLRGRADKIEAAGKAASDA